MPQKLPVTTRILADDLAYQCSTHPSGHADSLIIDVSAKYRARAVGAMAVPIAVTFAGKVSLVDIHVYKSGVGCFDACIENSNHHTFSIERRYVGADGRYSPSVCSNI